MTEQSINKPAAFEATRARLFALAYRMLGSRAEAEDVVQDVWLKWHLADTREVLTPAAWLTTLTTRTAIDRLRHLRRERGPLAEGGLPEPWLDALAPSAEELALRAADMSYGVMLMLERLKPDERAAFVLHEAFDCDYAEIARILARTPAGCRQLVHRAKQRLQRVGEPLKRPDPVGHARLVERLRTALEQQDRSALLSLFSEATEVVSAASVHEHEPSAPDWAATIGQVAALACHASHAEVVSVDGAAGLALLDQGEVIALIDVSARVSMNARSSASPGIATVRVVTCAECLRRVNRLWGRAAVVQLLARFGRDCVPSVAVRGDFPVDVHA